MPPAPVRTIIASIAVDQARASHRRLALFDAAAYGDPQAKLGLMSEMLGAIAAGDIFIHLQPKFDLRLGRTTGAEALVRWRHPQRGMVGPDDFIPMAEGQKDALLVRSTVDLAHSLGLKVTAEGVETAMVQALLAAMGCDLAQGYFIARPMTHPDLAAFLQRERDEADGDVGRKGSRRRAGERMA